jgi:hypothetical protein
MFNIPIFKISFFFDKIKISCMCVFKERLCTMVPFVAIQDTTLKINDVWHNGNWNLQILYTQLPTEVVNAITAIKHRIVHNLPDVWVWKNSSTGVYSVKDAYTWLSNPYKRTC